MKDQESVREKIAWFAFIKKKFNMHRITNLFETHWFSKKSPETKGCVKLKTVV